MATLSTVISYGEPTGTIVTEIGTPGPSGQPGPKGDTGAGVPAGGTSGQFLTKTTTGVDYATGWTTLSLAGYATESWVTSGFYPLTGNPSGFLVAADLSGYLPLAGGAMTGSITNSTAIYDTEMSGELFGVQLSADHTKGSTLQFNGLNTYEPGYYTSVAPTILKVFDSTNELGVTIAHDSIAIQHIDTPNVTAYVTNEYIGFEDLSGTPHSSFVEHDVITVQNDTANTAVRAESVTVTGIGTYSNGVTVTNETYNTSISPDGIYFGNGNRISQDENQFDLQSNPAIHINGGLIDATSGTNTLNIDGEGVSVFATGNSGATILNATGITFPDSTVQTSAAFVSGSGNLDMAGYDITNANFNSSAGQVSAQNVSLSAGGSITFGDSTVQTTAYTGGGGYITSVTSPLAVTSGDLSFDLAGYATESFVTSQGYISFSGDGYLSFPEGSNPDYLTNNRKLWFSSSKFRYNSTGSVLTVASESYVTGTLASYAPLASPTFSGTPSLPTGTIAVTQSPGNNTTAVATTAFVTAAVPAFATTADIN